jgi:hypothetical protein
MRFFRRRSPAVPPAAQPPEFGIRVVLRKGDKIVRRDAHGAVCITRVTQEHLDQSEVLRLTALRPRGGAQSRGA